MIKISKDDEKKLKKKIVIDEYRSSYNAPFMKIYVKGDLVFDGAWDEYKINLVYCVVNACKKKNNMKIKSS